MSDRNATYYPSVFETKSEADARQVILTPEEGTTTEERWVNETAFLLANIGDFLAPAKDALILDYGCGVGRLSRELIAEYGCHVVGVDISASMRQMAPAYVQSDRFSVVSKDLFTALVAKGLKVDAAISGWLCDRIGGLRTLLLGSSLQAVALLLVRAAAQSRRGSGGKYVHPPGHSLTSG